MARRQLYILGLVIFFFGAAMGFNYFSQKSIHPDEYVQLIEQYLHQRETEVRTILQDKNYIEQQIVSLKQAQLSFSDEKLEQFIQLSQKSYSLFFYNSDTTLITWTNNHVSLDTQLIKQILLDRSVLLHLDNGYYELIKYEYQGLLNCSNCFAIAAIPIKYTYILESEHLSNSFAMDEKIPQNIGIQLQQKTDYQIKNREGETLCYLDIPSYISSKNHQLILLSLLIIAFVLLGVWVNDISKQIATSFKPWAGAAFLIGTVFGLRSISILGDATKIFHDLELFARTFSTPVLNSSLGDLLINIVLLLWMMVFFHREFQVKPFVRMPQYIRYSLTSLNYFSIILGILMITSVFKSLVIDSGIIFDFDNVFHLETHSVLSIIGVLLLLLALFLFTHRMIHTIEQIALPISGRVVCLAIAVTATIPVMNYANLLLSPIYLSLMSIAYIALFDMFVDAKDRNQSLNWLVLWLVIFAAYASGLLYKYNGDKDLQTQLEYAQKLAIWQDDEAEKNLDGFRIDLFKDKDLQDLIHNQNPNKIPVKDFDKHIDKYYTASHYLFNNYVYQYWFFDETYQNLLSNQYDNEAATIMAALKKSGEETERENLSYIIDNQSQTLIYLMPLAFRQGEEERTLLLEFKRRKRESSKVYTELLLDVQYKNLDKLGKYDYAIYNNNRLVDLKGKSYEITLVRDDIPLPGERKEKFTSTRSEVIYQSPEGIVVIIGKNMGGVLKPFSLFSYLFLLLSVSLCVLAVINTVVKVLPKSLNINFFGQTTLRNRIQSWVILLIIFSFISIGIVTVLYFQDSSNRYHEQRLDRKVRSVLAHAELQQDMLDTLSIEIEKMAEAFSDVHRMDVNIFNRQGQLIGSSEDDIFKKGIIAPMMNPIAYYELSQRGQSKSVQPENIGNLNYKAAYVPLISSSGELKAYIGLPYYSKQRALKSDLYDFMGTLLNVYVFLLLVAGLIAVIVANSITSPIVKIGEKLKKFKLEGNNEPLEWTTNDELGELISEYNEMIKKVEDSKQKLKESEREVAWREMAKQVAHEIKNPLTPMKLSIQYLLHAYQANASNIEPLLRRVSQTLIEQIDGLTRIATEFSNFAKMPKAHNEKLNLNDLVSSVHRLFSENEEEEIEVNLFLPDQQFMVFADKDQLVRVFTNLIKNAIQAIPDERIGKIDVSMFYKDNMAIIKVSDNGCGIPETMREKVFHPNFTTKSSGTGLGLAMSRNIIDQAKGRIYFNTIIDKGTDFYVELPMLEVLEESLSSI